MVGLSNERIEQILHEETAKKEELLTILRGIYTRYMRLYERYFADIDALNDDEVTALKNYHEETISLVKHYYMDIPLDICMYIEEFDNKYNAKLLGPKWHEYLFGIYEDFRNENEDKGEEYIKAEFKKKALEDFYEAMDYVFREGFDTCSKIVDNTLNGITGLLFGKE